MTYTLPRIPQCIIVEGVDKFNNLFTTLREHFCVTRTVTRITTRRDVRVIVEGVDKFNNLFASVYVPGVAPAPSAANGALAGSKSYLTTRESCTGSKSYLNSRECCTGACCGAT